MDVGTKIRNARLAKGMTQSELGKILGIQKSAVAKYENGRIVNIKRSTIKKISEVLEIRPAELVGDFEEEKPMDENGLSKEKIALINFAKSVPEDKAAMILRVMKSIVEDGQ